MKAFQNAVTDTETILAKFKSVPPLPGFNPDSIPSRRRFLFRRVKLLRNLLKWRKYTGERFGLDVLVGRLLDVCILEVAQSGWDVGGEEITRYVCGSLVIAEYLCFSLDFRLRSCCRSNFCPCHLKLFDEEHGIYSVRLLSSPSLTFFIAHLRALHYI